MKRFGILAGAAFLCAAVLPAQIQQAPADAPIGRPKSISSPEFQQRKIRAVTRRANQEVLPLVRISLRGLDVVDSRRVESNSHGTFLAAGLIAGVYELTASKAGFADTRAIVTVAPAVGVSVALTLRETQQTNSGATNAPDSQTSDQEPPRRAPPAPLDGIYPGSEYLGPTVGVPDTDPVWPLTKALWNEFPALESSKIKIYGWVNPGGDYSTSQQSNVPESYAIVPNKLEMDQAVLRFERVPDTVQTDHVDWGFRLSVIYGIDYRYTTAQGWFSEQLLKRNSLYGADPVEAYGLVYVPNVAQGMLIQYGRYISPPDIEAQLAPSNYLYTHSLMFTVDCYTQTGINASIKLNDQWTVQFGVHAGDDIAPWNAAAQPTGMAMLRWASKSNNDSIWGGIDSINDGKFKAGHDDLQQDNLTWTHRFNKQGTILTSTEGYYIYQSGALVGGTVNNGPLRSFLLSTGPGTPISGNAPVVGLVNYTEFKISKSDFLSIRPLDYLNDIKGERTGFATSYASWTAGVTHRFSDLISVRPEVRYEHAFKAKPYDNGTRSSQFMLAVDAIIHF